MQRGDKERADREAGLRRVEWVYLSENDARQALANEVTTRRRHRQRETDTDGGETGERDRQQQGGTDE